jgi:serine/threonine-protein kinase HipA
MKELIVLLNEREAGRLRSEGGKTSFTYAESWRISNDTFPLSLSMPLTAKEHSYHSAEPYIWGLLPDNDQVLKSWAQRFQVSPRNAFELLSHVGEDCAGAVQFVRPENLETVLHQEQPEPEWLTEQQVAERLRIVRSDASAGRLAGDRGQFSLAGAQPKTALFFDENRWGVTSGRTPTTHILKPTTAEFAGHAENEHLCIRLAAALGLTTTQVHARYFEDVATIVVERYDRVILNRAAEIRDAHSQDLFAQAEARRAKQDPDAEKEAKAIEEEARQDLALAEALLEQAQNSIAARLHQEDFCQSLSIHPAIKYQNQGGPSVKQVVEVIRSNVSSHRSVQEDPKFSFTANDDVQTFVGALIFNWLIGGTDAHAKNYSVLIGPGGMVRLAPLYDVASILPYPSIDPRKAKMAMKIGERYELMEISFSDWRKLAASIRVDADALIERIRGMARELPDRLSDEINVMRKGGLQHRIIDTLGKMLPERAGRIAEM